MFWYSFKKKKKKSVSSQSKVHINVNTCIKYAYGARQKTPQTAKWSWIGKLLQSCCHRPKGSILNLQYER